MKNISLWSKFFKCQKNKKTTLAVDDNHDAADTLTILIRIYGCEGMVAYDNATGIALAHGSAPDIIFHVIGLPTMYGYG
jgi:DNA-binding response OmpR family regulator